MVQDLYARWRGKVFPEIDARSCRHLNWLKTEGQDKTGGFGALRPPATISKSCFRKVLRDERRANRHLQFIAQFAQPKSQTSSLTPFPPISLVVPQLRRVEV